MVLVLWPVDVIREGRNKFFENGWAKFVEDNGVELGDILIFQFNGDYHFDVKQFGKDTCEKVEDVGSFQLTIKPEEKEEERARKSNDWTDEKYKEEEEDAKVRKIKRTGSKKKTGGGSPTVGKIRNDVVAGEGEGEEDGCDDDEEEDEDDEEYDEEEEEEETKTDVERGHYEEDEGDSRMKNIKVTVPRKETGTSSAGATKLVRKRKNRSKGKGVVRDEPEVEKRPKKTEDRITDAEIFESGAVARPKNPYFIAKPAGKRKELCIPGDVVKDHQLKFLEYMDIHDEEGKNWRAAVVVWKDGRVVLKKGWKAFCKWNNVKERDKCLCEFVVDSKQRVLQLQVRIFRAG